MVSGPSNTMQPPATAAPTPLGTSTLSPVNMDSSMAARPSITSPSQGTRSPARQHHTVQSPASMFCSTHGKNKHTLNLISRWSMLNCPSPTQHTHTAPSALVLGSAVKISPCGLPAPAVTIPPIPQQKHTDTVRRADSPTWQDPQDVTRAH
jgi:hypothetical protein